MGEEKIATQIIRSVAELPDRTSPVDFPEAMIVTPSELSQIIETTLLESQHDHKAGLFKPFGDWSSVYALLEHDLEHFADEIDCDPSDPIRGCQNVTFDPSTNCSECTYEDEGRCPFAFAEALRAVSNLLSMSPPTKAEG